MIKQPKLTVKFKHKGALLTLGPDVTEPLNRISYRVRGFTGGWLDSHTVSPSDVPTDSVTRVREYKLVFYVPPAVKRLSEQLWGFDEEDLGLAKIAKELNLYGFSVTFGKSR